MNTTLTAIDGIRVGQSDDRRAVTGCAVILLPPHTTARVDLRGAMRNPEISTGYTTLASSPPMHHVPSAYVISPNGGVPGSTDGTSITRDSGVPVVIDGPILTRSPHQPDEYVDLSVVDSAARLHIHAALQALSPMQREVRL